MRKVAVFAHRGASGTHPENTAAAFAEALRLGVEAVEFDVRLTADRKMVVIHDATVDRTSDGHGEVRHMTLAQMTELDAGAWFDAQYTGERFKTLEAVLDHGAQAITGPARRADHDVMAAHRQLQDGAEAALADALFGQLKALGLIPPS